MDNLHIISSITMSLMYGGYQGIQFCKKKYKNKIFVVLMSCVDDIQEVIRDIDKDDRIIPLILPDILKDFLKGVEYGHLKIMKKHNKDYYDVLLYKYIKEYMNTMKKHKKNSIFVVFTDTPNLLDKFTIKKENVTILLPSLKYNLKITNKLHEDDKAEEITYNREKLNGFGYEKTYFNDFKELKQILRKILNPLER